MSVVPPKNIKYKIRFNLYEITDLPQNSKVHIEVQCGSYHITSEKAKIQNGAGSWFVGLPDIEADFPQDKTQIPDIFIHVFIHEFLSSSRIGYIRVPASSVGLQGAPTWSLIQPDIFTDEKSPSILGFLQYSLQLGAESEMGVRPAFKKPSMKKLKIAAYIYQAEDLPVADSDGNSDAYVVVRCGSSKANSKVIKNSLYPRWYETLILPIEIPSDRSLAPDIQLLLMDQDSLKDDYMCRTSVPFSAVTETFSPKPKW